MRTEGRSLVFVIGSLFALSLSRYLHVQGFESASEFLGQIVSVDQFQKLWLVVFAEQADFLFCPIIQKFDYNWLHRSDDHIASYHASAVLSPTLDGLEEVKHSFGVIDEHLFVPEAICVDDQDELIDLDWHVANKFIRQVAGIPTELFLWNLLKIEVPQQNEHHGTTLCVAMSSIIYTIHVK